MTKQHHLQFLSFFFKNTIVLFFFLLLSVEVNAQYFQTGQDPASIRWRHINTVHFQIIYPDYYESKAKELAGIMEKVYDYPYKSFQYKPRKISIILHTQTVQSNGLVAWAPSRSEFYTTPHQGIYAQDWIKQLAIHEFRHVMQIDRMDVEIPRILKILLGEQATAGVFGLYMPWWFIEGDAVVMETALSKYGRGRFPEFLMEHKALMVENPMVSYDQAYNGSYKMYIPNHYQLGYYLVGESRIRYGTDLWEKVQKRVASKPFSLNPFNKALRDITGYNKVGLYESVFDSLRQVWLKEDQNYQSQSIREITLDKEDFSSYRYNHYLDDEKIVSSKSTLKDPLSFVEIDEHGKERKIFIPGVIFNESVNFRGEWLVYSERIPDPRWSHSGRSLIRLYNLRSGDKLKIDTEYKAFAPSLSHKQDRVCVVESDFSDQYSLAIYGVHNGQVEARISTDKNHYIFSPEWISETEIAVILLSDNGKRIAVFNVESGNYQLLEHPDYIQVKGLRSNGKDLLFVADTKNKTGIYNINLETQKITFLYEPRFGAESIALSPNKDRLTISDYTSKGFRLIEIPYGHYEEGRESNPSHFQLAENLAEQESGILRFDSIDTTQYSSSEYKKIKHLFRFHSWAPLSVDPVEYQFKPGISLMSQNNLGTSITTLGYEWDTSERTGMFYGNYTFKGWYPVWNIELSNGKRSAQYRIIEEYTNNDGEIIEQDTSIQNFSWRTTNIETSLSVPLSFSRGQYSRFLQPAVIYEWSHNYKHDEFTPDGFKRGDINALNYSIYYRQYLKRGYQDVYPNFGVSAEGRYYHTPFGGDDLGTMWMGQSFVFLPGFLKTHGTRIYSGGHLKEPVGNRSFLDVIKYPRGWAKTNSEKMLSLGIDYKFPLIHPDLSIWGLAYVKRITTSIFADYGWLEGGMYRNSEKVGTYTSQISSYGLELLGDMHFMRFYAPVQVGFRTSYLPEDDSFSVNFLLSIDFESL